MSITFHELFLIVVSYFVMYVIGWVHKKIPVQRILTLRPPSSLRKIQRGRRYNELVLVKNNRHDKHHYDYELQKSQNWFIVFVVTGLVNFNFLLSHNFLEYSLWLFLIFMFPTFIAEFIWLNKMSYVEDLRVYQKNSFEWKNRRKRKVEYKKNERKRLKAAEEKKKLQQSK